MEQILKIWELLQSIKQKFIDNTSEPKLQMSESQNENQNQNQNSIVLNTRFILSRHKRNCK